VVADRVKDGLAEAQKSLPAGVKIEPLYDRKDLVNRTIPKVTRNLIEGRHPGCGDSPPATRTFPCRADCVGRKSILHACRNHRNGAGEDIRQLDECLGAIHFGLRCSMAELVRDTFTDRPGDRWK
jgi:hypothetical protein